jgi:pSer/pThr/pTyr-binding forkhead associated (FHA) protein
MRIRITPPAGKSWDVEFGGGTMSIGRSPACALQIDDRSVSRKHAELFMGSDGRILVRDSESRYGVLINDQRIRGAAEFRSGDRLDIGGYLLHLINDSPTPIVMPALSRDGITRKIKNLPEAAPAPDPLAAIGQLAPSAENLRWFWVLFGVLGLLGTALLLLDYLNI